MTSSISLSLVLLALVAICFTLPVIEQQHSTSTVSVADDHLNTETINGKDMAPLQKKMADGPETTMSPMLPSESSSITPSKLDLSTSASGDDLEKKVTRPSRMTDELSTTGPTSTMTSTTSMDERADTEEKKQSETTDETSTRVDSKPEREVKSDEQDLTMTTASDETIKRDFEHETSTTTQMPPFTSTSSAVAPQFYTAELLATSMKSETKSTETEVSGKEKKESFMSTGDDVKVMINNSDDHAEDKSSEESTVESTTESESTSTVRISMMTEEKSDVKKTDEMRDIAPESSTSTESSRADKQPLNQGEKQPITEEKKSNN